MCSPKLSSLTAGVAFLLYNSVSVVHHQSSEQITAAAASLRKTKTEQNIVGLRMEELHREISVLEAQKASDGPDDEESQRVRFSRIHCSTCDQASSIATNVLQEREKLREQQAQTKQLAEQVKAVEMDLNDLAEEKEGIRRQLLALQGAEIQVRFGSLCAGEDLTNIYATLR